MADDLTKLRAQMALHEKFKLAQEAAYKAAVEPVAEKFAAVTADAEAKFQAAGQVAGDALKAAHAQAQAILDAARADFDTAYGAAKAEYDAAVADFAVEYDKAQAEAKRAYDEAVYKNWLSIWENDERGEPVLAEKAIAVEAVAITVETAVLDAEVSKLVEAGKVLDGKVEAPVEVLPAEGAKLG